MNFNDFPYERPSLTDYQEKFSHWLTAFQNASDLVAAKAALKKINQLHRHLETMAKLAYIRHSIDTKDAFYLAENQYWDQKGPLFDALHNQFYQALLETPYKDQLAEAFPQTLFLFAEDRLRLLNEAVIPDVQAENETVSRYDQLIAGAEITFQNKKMTLPEVAAFFTDPDEKVRQEAQAVHENFFIQHENDFDQLFQQLVHLRTKIAQELGFENYVAYGDVNMNRWGYNREDLKKYRQFILTKVVPATQILYQRQAQRLKKEKLYHYDLPLVFPEGNARPLGTETELVGKARQMYHELSPETGAFFEKLTAQKLLDLATRPGKSSGGYCEFIDDFEMPFIFANFNGTSDDVDVLTHEAGHAFQSYTSRWITEPELVFPTSEAAEIHSMSMEFLTWPWMDNFFGAKSQQYRFAHLSSALQFLSYGALVDHFQEEVYSHPDWTPTERKNCWRTLEKQYLPHKDYTYAAGLARGIYWYRQGHIFEVPFYYIDYTLAQVCAFQFWQRSHVEKDPTTWQDYLAICQVGGSQSFLEIVETGHLASPFDEEKISQVIDAVSNYLASIPESEL